MELKAALSACNARNSTTNQHRNFAINRNRNRVKAAYYSMGSDYAQGISCK